MSRMETYLKQHKIFLTIFACLLGIIIISGPIYRLAGPRLIGSIYRGKSLPFLNRMITDQTRRPVETYLAHGENLFNRFRVYLLSLLFFFCFYFLYNLITLVSNRRLQNIGILILVIMAMLWCIELFFKYVMPVEIGAITFENFQPSLNPDIVIEPRPSEGEFNRDGFRDREYPKEKPEGIYRVAVIGDSLAYGLRVVSEDTYAKQLEEMLNEHSEGDRRYEVLNMGVPGYRTVQIIARFREKGLSYDPDLVIYGYWLDDIGFSGLVPFYFNPVNLKFSEKVHSLMSASALERNIKKLLLRSQIVRRFILLMREVSRRKEYGGEKGYLQFAIEEGMKEPDREVADLYRMFRDKIDQGEYKDPPESEPYYARYGNYNDFLLWNDSLKKFSETCRSEGIDCLLLITPVIYDYGVSGYAWEGLHRFLRNVAEHYGIPSLDLKEEFGKYESHQLRAGDLEHPSPRGHKIIAEKLYEWIVRGKGLKRE